MGPHPERFAGVVPEYNLHGDINGDYWNRLFTDFPSSSSSCTTTSAT
ncbi:hypothetical protein O1L60_38615 [Streptomyces diastatochromogenes]|nr:hypothetical protein [Streptomyces diastatochromogenes]